jgi:hypothetical protein
MPIDFSRGPGVMMKQNNGLIALKWINAGKTASTMVEIELRSAAGSAYQSTERSGRKHSLLIVTQLRKQT